MFGAVLLEIRDLLYPHWFELFQAVGLDRKVLVDINERYRKDPKVCMVEGIRLWLEHYRHIAVAWLRANTLKLMLIIWLISNTTSHLNLATA